jgi:hypothetical protein
MWQLSTKYDGKTPCWQSDYVNLHANCEFYEIDVFNLYDDIKLQNLRLLFTIHVSKKTEPARRTLLRDAEYKRRLSPRLLAHV